MKASFQSKKWVQTERDLSRTRRIYNPSNHEQRMNELGIFRALLYNISKYSMNINGDFGIVTLGKLRFALKND